MPLDPSFQALLEMLLPPGAPTYSGLGVAGARRAVAELLLMQSGEAEPVGRVEDRAVPGPGGDIPVRCYAPAEPGGGGGALPILLFFHGGGWTLGDLDFDDALCRSLTNRARCLTLSVDYRLAPEHRFPEPLEDCLAVARWAEAHGPALGGDPRRIAVGGESAGGNLAAALALAARDQGGPRVVHQLLLYPSLDPACDSASYRDNGEGYLLTATDMRWFWGNYLTRPEDAEHPYAAPLRATDLHGLPGATVITAEYDPLRDEGEAYGARLSAAGIQVRLRRYPGVPHGFVTLAHEAPVVQDALDFAAEGLREAFRAGSAC